MEADTYITVLGIAQDGGYPHINNPMEFEGVLNKENQKELVVSLGLVDKIARKKYLFEATPNMPEQLYNLERELETSSIIDGILVTGGRRGG